VSAGQAASRPQPQLAEPSPAWRELWALACAMRPQWDAVAWQGAVIACRDAGVPFGNVAVAVWKLVWDAGAADPAALTTLARQHIRQRAFDRTGLTAEERAELRENALAACEAAAERYRAAERGEEGADP
jgi:hypothetical protein